MKYIILARAKIFFTIAVLCFAAVVFPFVAGAMSSQNYKIPSDSVNVGGREEKSATYLMDETIGESGTGESSSESYKIKAGFQEMQEVYLSVSSPSDVAMAPAIGGVTGGTGSGSASWTIITDNPAGYAMSIKSSVSPALQSGVNNFANYTPAAPGVPDYDWAISGADSEFGFTAESGNLVQKFLDDGVDCNAGLGDTANKCWYNLSSSNETIVNSSSANQPGGEAATVKFQAQSGASHLQIAGTYTATITVTVVAN